MDRFAEIWQRPMSFFLSTISNVIEISYEVANAIEF